MHMYVLLTSSLPTLAHIPPSRLNDIDLQWPKTVISISLDALTKNVQRLLMKRCSTVYHVMLNAEIVYPAWRNAVKRE